MAAGESYEEFVEKFKPKKTTDDCYTPPSIYAVIRDWTCKEYGIDPAKIVPRFTPAAIMKISTTRRVPLFWTTHRFQSCPESADSISIVAFRSSYSLHL